ncbi:DNA-binding protein [Dyella subtropica]|uniref:DNA-binding protein n=1 Tax=Dyella subtropica TaxID=2992127 RepID=UPI00225B67E0|nr:DNA-binding protein [Dyella subtropica]
MARTSDTRTLTRKAAAQLATQGRLPHTLTVDQIYEVIRQGSRTTINDELKQWKAERAKSDALADTLPPPLADAMCSLWASAVEQAAEQFAAEREHLTAALTTVQAQVHELTLERDAQVVRSTTLDQEIASLTERLDALRQSLARIETAHAVAMAEATTLRTELEQLRHDAALERSEARASYHAALVEHDQAFRQELDQATDRLQRTEAQMLKQVDDARVAHRRTETQLTRLQEQHTTARTELAEVRQRALRDQQELTASRHALASAQERIAQLETHATERDRALVSVTAQYEAANRIIATLEATLKASGRRPRSRPQAH